MTSNYLPSKIQRQKTRKNIGSYVKLYATIKQIQDDNTKLVQLATTLRERDLTWYMKYTSATCYSKITTDLMIEPELDSSSMSHNTDGN